jgi:hypothetical protein
VFKNINNHLKQDGIIIMGISFNQQSGHYILENKSWWISKFLEFNLTIDEDSHNLMTGRYQKHYSTSHYFCFKKIYS